MARVTIEDCELVVPNRFQLVVLAGQRVKQFQNGAQLTIERDNDKDPVVALREIAGRTISIDNLKDQAINSLRQTFFEEEEEDVEDDDYDPTIETLDLLAEDSDGESDGEEGSEDDLDDDLDDDDSVDPEASIDFSCIIQEADEND